MSKFNYYNDEENKNNIGQSIFSILENNKDEK